MDPGSDLYNPKNTLDNPEHCGLEKKCINTIELTGSGGVCNGQGAECGRAMRAAGLQGPYYAERRRYDVDCLVTLGLLLKGTGTAVGIQVQNNAEQIARGFGATAERAAQAGRIGAVLSNPVVTAGTIGYSAFEVFKKCECKK